MTAWYEDSFGCEYLELYAHRDDSEAMADIRAIVELLSPPKDEPLLDLCCGACRHLLVLREMGFSKLVGLDLSQELLDVAAQRLAECDPSPSQAPCSVELVRSDMRLIPYQDYFATVLSLFTSFGYFARDEENLAVFQAVDRALKPGGRFLIDYLNREYVIASLVERDEQALADRHIVNARRLTPDRQRVEKTTTVTTPSGLKREYHESVRMYSQAEVVDMLTASGFADIRCYGSLDGRPLAPESKRLILIAGKKQ